MNRRKFIQQSCSLCVAVGAGMVVGSLSSCATLPVYKTTMANNQVIVPDTLFAQSNFQLIQPKNLYYNIGLKKETDGSYTALLLKCTHADNQLSPAGNAGYRCSLHGSTFSVDGKVTAGPAERPLKKYQTEVQSNQIIIHLS